MTPRLATVPRPAHPNATRKVKYPVHLYDGYGVGVHARLKHVSAFVYPMRIMLWWEPSLPKIYSSIPLKYILAAKPTV